MALLDDVNVRLAQVPQSVHTQEVVASVQQHRQMVARWLGHPPPRSTQANAAATILSVIASANAAAHAAHEDTGSWRPVQAEVRAAQHSMPDAQYAMPEAGALLHFDLDAAQGRGIAEAVLSDTLVPTPLDWLPKAGSQRVCEIRVAGIGEPIVLIAECVGIETPDGVLLQLTPASDRQRQRLVALAAGAAVEVRSAFRDELPTLTEDRIEASVRRQVATARASHAVLPALTSHAPVTQAPVTQAPVTQAPVTQVLPTQAPVTQVLPTQVLPAQASVMQPPSGEETTRQVDVAAMHNEAPTATARGRGHRASEDSFIGPLFDTPRVLRGNAQDVKVDDALEHTVDDAIDVALDDGVDEPPTVEAGRREVSTVRPPPLMPSTVEALLSEYCDDLSRTPVPTLPAMHVTRHPQVHGPSHVAKMPPHERSDTQELPEVSFAKAPIGAFPHHSDVAHIVPVTVSGSHERITPVPMVVSLETVVEPIVPRRRRRGGALLLAASVALGLFASPTPNRPATAYVARTFATTVTTVVERSSSVEQDVATEMVSVKRILVRKMRRPSPASPSPASPSPARHHHQ